MRRANPARAPGVAFVLALVPLIATSTAHAEPFAYVTNFNSNNVSVIDTATNTVVATVAVADFPEGIAITPDGAFAYVATSSGVVSVIDTATNTVAATVNAGLNPGDVAITPDGAFAYVTNGGSDDVSVIDTASNSVVATVAVGSLPVSVAITPGGAFAYVANLFGSVSVIDTTTNTVTATVPVEVTAFDVAITPDGDFAYVTSDIGDTVSVIETSSNTVTSTVPAPDSPIDVAITPDGAFAYVANFTSQVTPGSVSVIDTASNAVIATVTVGIQPAGIAITPETSSGAVRIDIKPGSDENGINLRSNGNVAVAVLSGGTFDATQVDWETVAFGPDGARDIHGRSHVRDVDHDGDADIVLHFKIRQTGIQCGDEEATLRGQTFSGQAFSGTGDIVAVKCPR